MRIIYVALLAAALVACGDNHNGPSSLSVSPSSLSLAVGDSMSVGAVFDNGDTTTPITWTSDDTSIASVTSTQNGIAIVTAVAAGTTMVTATGAGLTATVMVAVTAAQVRSIGITPAVATLPAAMTLQLTATGVYSDSSTQDLTNQVLWSSSDDSVASISSSGLVSGLAAGTVTISADLDGFGLTASATITVTQATLSSIQVTPTNPSLAKGTTQQLTATGVFSDSTTLDLTDMVTWASDTPGVASVDGSGDVSAVAVGSASVRAALGSASGSTMVTVTDAVVTSLEVDPASATIAIANAKQYSAIAHFSDTTTQDVTGSASWMSNDPDVAAIDATGSAVGVGSGSATITAMYAGFAGSGTLTVTGDAITGIEISPVDALVGSGMTIQMHATALFAIAAPEDITAVAVWSAGSDAIAAVSNATGARGLATGIAPGTATITAAFGSASGSTSLNVTASPLTSIVVTPVGADVPLGIPQQFTATGFFGVGGADGSADVTQNVTWASGSAAIATISNADGSRGLATTIAAGSTTITATDPATGVFDSTSFTVDPAALDHIVIDPGSASIPLGIAQQFTATGFYTDGGSADITSSVTWDSGSADVVAISNASGSNGVATALSLGSTTITATDPTTLKGSAVPVSATAAVLESISLSTPTDLDPGQTEQLVATGHYSDGSTPDLTTIATWASSGSAIATVDSGATGGTVTAIAPGTVQITATSDGVPSDPVSLTVNVGPPAVASIAPADGLVGVLPRPVIAVTFNQPMDWATVTGAASDGDCGTVGGSIQLSNDGFTTCLGIFSLGTGSNYAAFLPNDTTLVPSATYQVRVLGSVANPSAQTLGSPVTQSVGFTTATSQTCASGLVISQLYGAGGNSGAVYDHDFVELHNAGPSDASLGGLSIQYAGSNGSSWTKVSLPSDDVPPGGYFLVQLQGGGSGAALPYDFGSASISMATGAGKVVLVDGTTTVTSGTACPTAGILDFVGYGTNNCTSGTATLTTATAAIRNGGGCFDVGDNHTDFSTGTPAPRHGTGSDGSLTPSPVDVCSCIASGSAELDYCDLQSPVSMALAPDSPGDAYGQVYEEGVTPNPAASILMQLGYGAYLTDPNADPSWTWVASTFNQTVDNNNEYVGTLTSPDGSGQYSYTTRMSFDGTNWTYCDIDGNGMNAGLSYSGSELGTLTVSGD